MKLSQKLNRTFIIILIILISASAFTAIFTFNDSLLKYIQFQRQKEFTSISNDIVKIIEVENGLSNVLLKDYVSENNISIKYYNNDNKLISQFNGIENYENFSKNSFATQKFLLKDSFENNIGYLEISYIDNIYEYDNSVIEFRKEIMQKYAIIFIAAMMLTTLLIVVFSRNITIPITEIQEQTKKIRQGIFEKSGHRYNIYELDQLSADIDYLSTTLEMQDNFRSDYARDIAHELRTPMTNLLLHLEGIQDEIIEADEDTINLLISEIKRLNDMIDDLEVSFNNTKENSKLNLEKTSLKEILTNVSSSFTPLLDEKNITLIKSFDEDKIIETDKLKLTQILSNIISNAIKAVENNGEISIIHKSYKNRDVIRISDNGIGISKENIKHIFERFYRIDDARNTKQNGSGLGLAITKNYADLLNYRINVSSTEGKGTEFIITI